MADMADKIAVREPHLYLNLSQTSSELRESILPKLMTDFYLG